MQSVILLFCSLVTIAVYSQDTTQHSKDILHANVFELGEVPLII